MAGYDVRIIEDKLPDGRHVWLAEYPALLGCHAVGATPEEASERLRESYDAWMTVARRRGKAVPDMVASPTTVLVYAHNTEAAAQLIYSAAAPEPTVVSAAPLPWSESERAERLALPGEWGDAVKRAFRAPKPPKE